MKTENHMSTKQGHLQLGKHLQAFIDNQINVEELIKRTSELRVTYTRDGGDDDELINHLFSVIELQDNLQLYPLEAGRRLQDAYDYCHLKTLSSKY
ncbi:hypothetical protein IJI99_02775 [bacterium]|nr:hypothetical protein [bacterium]